jgi:hypothetical protein
VARLSIYKFKKIYISVISFLTVQKKPVSNPTFFDLSENWRESFQQKIEVHLLFRPKSLPQKYNNFFQQKKLVSMT